MRIFQRGFIIWEDVANQFGSALDENNDTSAHGVAA